LRQPPAQQQLIVSKPTSGFYNSTSNSCNCGFSAVRHRYLSMKAGLFAEDAKEATDINETQSQPAIPHTIWFDSMSGRDMNFIALLREQTLVRDLGGLLDQVTLLSLQCERASQTERIGSDSSKHCEYIISEVDQRELPLVFQAACEVACMEMNCRRPPHDVRSVLLHDWGVQISNEMREPRESECMALLQEIGPILEESLRIARSSPLFGSNNIVEGPLTWRFFDRKALKAAGGTEDDSGPEAVPNIVVASEKDAVITSPQIIRLWEKMSLEPYDQPKDVLYIGVVPDNLICIEKTKKYLMDLSRMYEQCRFGRHIPFSREVLRDGLLRVPTRYPATNPGECDNFLNQVERHIGDNKSLITRLKVYMQYFENEMARILINNDDIFSRDKYRAALAESQIHSVQHISIAAYQCGGYTVSSSDHMPPPSAPGSIIISGQSGDASHGPNSTSGPSSSGITIGESLTPDGSIGDGSAQNMTNFSSFMTEQLVADGIIAEDEPGTLPHVIVIYLVNPFLLGAEENPLVARVVTVALMRAFNALLYRLNNKRRPQLQLEMIALQNIFDYCGASADFLKDERGRLNGYDQGRLEKSQNERLSSSDSLKTIAFSVYTHSRVVLPDIVRGILPKSMTRFGPASAMVDLLNELERKEPIYYKVPSKPFILAPPSPVMQRPNCDLMQINTDEAVLFVSYCLIGNDWLAATVTDHQGHSLDNCLINLRLKPDHKRVNMRYKQSTQIRDSLYRLWSYILGTLANGTRNWRLVIGRVGRIGHGEFKFWTQILSKSYLKQVGTRMKHVCRACHVMPGTSEVPGVLSACLVSLEPEAHLRVFPSSFQHDDRFLKNSRHRALTTPDDTSCTHILVFPTSPELNLDHQGGNGVAELEEDDFSNLLTEEIGEEFSELIGNGEDLMTNGTGPPPQSASFRLGGNTGIPSEYAGEHIKIFQKNQSIFLDVSIENQPLATGYYISTAPASDLPEWFWSACPSAKRRNPVHLKSSLHLNTPNVQQGDDISSFGKGTEACHHQLDSQATADVLRYVLEMYNALSWLNMDLVSGERRSCLPIHIQALMWLCNAVNRFIN
uniref:Mediator of RNA polymerase II transcription subunit 13 n=1 Tax=Brugia timori TaxID=42155 RepID=A0A0R3QPB6_9BILA